MNDASNPGDESSTKLESRRLSPATAPLTRHHTPVFHGGGGGEEVIKKGAKTTGISPKISKTSHSTGIDGLTVQHFSTNSRTKSTNRLAWIPNAAWSIQQFYPEKRI